MYCIVYTAICLVEKKFDTNLTKELTFHNAFTIYKHNKFIMEPTVCTYHVFYPSKKNIDLF